MPEEPPACLGCGTCCFSKLVNYVRVDGADHSRIGVAVDTLTHFDGNRCYMNMYEGHCAALAIELGTGQFVCSIYETRPSICRELQRSSPSCQGEIHDKSERPLLLLSSLLARRAAREEAMNGR